MDDMKLREVFPQTTVFKDQKLIDTFKAANIPSFLRDWILKRKANEQGRIDDPDALRKYVDQIIPRRAEWLDMVDDARERGETRKFLANVRIAFNAAKNRYTFEIPELGLQSRETVIEDYVWNRIKDDVKKTAGGWGWCSSAILRPTPKTAKSAM